MDPAEAPPAPAAPEVNPEELEEVRSTTSTPPLEEQLEMERMEAAAAEGEGDGGGEGEDESHPAGEGDAYDPEEPVDEEPAPDAGAEAEGTAAAADEPQLSPVSANGSVGGGDGAAEGAPDDVVRTEIYSPLSSEAGDEERQWEDTAEKASSAARRRRGNSPEEGEIDGGGISANRASGEWERRPGEDRSPPQRPPSGEDRSRDRRSDRKRRRERSHSGEDRRDSSWPGGRGHGRTDLPRYDVRNIINSRRSARVRPSSPPPRDIRGGHDRRSPGRNRSWSRSPSRSGRVRSWSRSRSRSRSPARKRKKKKDKPTKKTAKRSVEVAGDQGTGKKVTKKTKKSGGSPKDDGVKKKKKKKGKDKAGKKGKKTNSAPVTLVEDVGDGSYPEVTTRGAVTNAINHASGVVSAKEVFAAGDKIMVSVNFKRNKKKKKKGAAARLENGGGGPSSAADGEAGEAEKPVACVIDLEMSPYGVYEPDPQHETVDLRFTDEEDGGDAEGSKQQDKQKQPEIEVLEVASSASAKGQKGSSGPGGNQRDTSSSSPLPQVIPIAPGHRGPCTPPLATDHETLDFTKGPETPPPPTDLDSQDGPGAADIAQGSGAGVGTSSAGASSGQALDSGGDDGGPAHIDDSYDPYDPTESPTADDIIDGVGDSAAGQAKNGVDGGSFEQASTPSKQAPAAASSSSSFWDVAVGRSGGAAGKSGEGSQSTSTPGGGKNFSPMLSIGTTLNCDLFYAAGSSSLSLFEQLSKGLVNGSSNGSSAAPKDAATKDSGNRMLNGGKSALSFNINAAALASSSALGSAAEDKTVSRRFPFCGLNASVLVVIF